MPGAVRAEVSSVCCHETWAALVARSFRSAGEILDRQRDQLQNKLGATELNAQSGTQCGFPAETITYTAPPTGKQPAHHSTVLCVVAEVDAKTHLATITIGTVDPKNATYEADSTQILKGFQVLATRH